jgi:ABC-type antimicrobial peptide transport system permease subunit
MKKQKNENVSYLSEVLDKLKEHKMAMAGLVVLIVEILMVVFLPMILKLDPYTIRAAHLSVMLLPEEMKNFSVCPAGKPASASISFAFSGSY